MADITIKGIRFDEVTVTLQSNGQHAIESARYSVINSLDKVFAEQSLGTFNHSKIKVPVSEATKEALIVFLRAYGKDVEDVIGIGLA